MRLSFLILSAAGLAISTSGVASATEITGGISINLVGVTIPSGTLATTTNILFTSVYAGPGSGYFLAIPGPTQVKLPNPTSKSIDPQANSGLDLTFAGLGYFLETGITVESVNSTFLDIELTGNFFPSTVGDDETPFTLDMSFTKTGPQYSGSGTLYDPPPVPAPTPEPSSLILLGTGLLGVAYFARRGFTPGSNK